jgi:lipoprotein-anchoring transpeptidase ErfK/SrfK
MDRPETQRSLERLWSGPLAVVIALLTVAGCIVVVARWQEPEPAVAAPTTTVAPTTTTTAAPKPEVPVSTELATPNGVIPTYDAPAGKQIGKVGRWYGYPMTMPIVEHRRGWLRIRLPERPNNSTAWVQSGNVVGSRTAYRIVIRLSQTNLTVYRAGFPLFTVPAGVGKPSTPTAPGSFFVAVIEKPGPSPGYGPIVLNTSGHSEAIQSWEGMGDAITAIHGPISASSDARIGTTGTYISNGCIRLHTADQLKLDMIPLGTPVDIVP